MLQLCRSWLKTEQNCGTLIDVGTKLYAKMIVTRPIWVSS